MDNAVWVLSALCWPTVSNVKCQGDMLFIPLSGAATQWWPSKCWQKPQRKKAGLLARSFYVKSSIAMAAHSSELEIAKKNLTEVIGDNVKQ